MSEDKNKFSIDFDRGKETLLKVSEDDDCVYVPIGDGVIENLKIRKLPPRKSEHHGPNTEAIEKLGLIWENMEIAITRKGKSKVYKQDVGFHHKKYHYNESENTSHVELESSLKNWRDQFRYEITFSYDPDTKVVKLVSVEDCE